MYDGIARKSSPYLFLGQTTSLCETCLGLVPAKIVEEDGRIYYAKRCIEHGVMKTLVSDDPGPPIHSTGRGVSRSEVAQPSPRSSNHRRLAAVRARTGELP